MTRISMTVRLLPKQKRVNNMRNTTLCHIERDGKYLMLHRVKKENDLNHDKWVGIGGKFEDGESPEECNAREVFEETGIHYEIDRLAVIHENFFNENNGSLKGLNCHEVCFYFLMKPRGTQELNSNSYTHGYREEMHWIPIRELSKYKAFPSFLKDYFSKEHSHVEHIITDQRN